MGLQKCYLGLGLSTVATLTIPPTCTIGVQDGARGTLDGNLGAANGKQRSGPLLVAPGGSAFKDDGGVISKLGQVKGRARRNSDVVQDNCGASSL